eukprot:TRINITY_DN30259_c0_g1_i1.p1 TRINITY_DN30259_c0_g1~~TRINITY_DN30259_c0_g1_i1.p1  ORF type:complete len:594 (+),score=183.99 TRINITY_DN30259_c0_g1_i1:66-1784(+)
MPPEVGSPTAASQAADALSGRSFAELLEPGGRAVLEDLGWWPSELVPGDDGTALALGDRLLSELRGTAAELARQRNEAVRLRCRLQAAESERDAHKALLVRHRRDAQEARKETRLAQDELKRLEQALQREQQERAAVDQRIEQLLLEDRAARADVREVEEADAQRTLAAAREQETLAREELRDMGAELEKARAALREEQRRLQRAQDDRATLAEEALRLREEVCELQEKLAAAEEDAGVLRGRIEAMQRPPEPPAPDLAPDGITATVRLRRESGVVGMRIDGSPPVIQEVFPGGAAEACGLQQGMTIAAIAGHTVSSAAELADSMRAAGLSFDLTVLVPPGRQPPPPPPDPDEKDGDEKRDARSVEPEGVFDGALPDTAGFRSCQDALDCAHGGVATVELLAKCVREAVQPPAKAKRRGSSVAAETAVTAAALRTAEQEGAFALALAARLHQVLWWVDDVLRGVTAPPACAQPPDAMRKQMLLRQGRELRALEGAAAKARDAIGMLRRATAAAPADRGSPGSAAAPAPGMSMGGTAAGPMTDFGVNDDYFAPLSSDASPAASPTERAAHGPG